MGKVWVMKRIANVLSTALYHAGPTLALIAFVLIVGLMEGALNPVVELEVVP